MTVRRRMAGCGLVTLALLAGAGCSSGEDHVVTGDGPGSSSTTAVPSTTTYPDPGGEPEYETWSTVIQAGGTPARLCIQGVLESLPPQCAGGPEITNWDWTAAPAADHRGGTRWADAHVRGTCADGRFTLTAPPEAVESDDPDRPDDTSDRPGIGCPEPDGGWVVTDPAKVADEHALIAAAQAEPDFAGIWLTDLEPPRDDGYQDLSKAVFTVTFTGDLERHRAELAQVWGGPLCVAAAARPKAELEAVAARIQGDVASGALGDLEVTSVVADEATGQIRVGAVVAPDGEEERLAERYGIPVALSAALRPVS